MKKGLIVFLVFAVVLVIGLWFIAEVKANEVNTKLTIDSANTSVVVKDSTGQQMSNNSNLVLNATYTLVVMPDENYELKVLTLNEEDILPNLVDNTYSFVCNGAITIKVASALISSGEIPDIPTEYLSFNYLGSIIAHKNLFGLGGVTTGVLNIYDNELTLLATLEAGQSYEYILPGNTYLVEFERLSGWGFAWLQSRLVNSGSFEPTAYKNGETFENVLHSLDFRVEYHGGYSSTSYVGSAISITDIDNNEVFNLTAGETYTINDISPAGYKVVLSQNGVDLALPYTFTYVEDITFDCELKEVTGVYMTLIGTNDAEDATPYVGIVFNPTTNTTTYFDWRIIDTCTFFVDLSEYIGCQLSFDLNLDYLPIAISVNGSPVLSDFAYLTITEDLHAEIELGWSGIRPSPPALVG